MFDRTEAVIPLTASLLAVIATFSLIDLLLDLGHGASWPHLASELLIVLLSLGAILWLAIRWRATHAEGRALCRRLDRHRSGVAERIEAQFRVWGLTAAESCIAMLLLKGLSLQQIADSCNRSERTIRQHAIAVYKKSGLAGRAELAAFFMEDLLPPVDADRDGVSGS